MKKIFFSVLFLVYIFQKEYACGFLHSWPRQTCGSTPHRGSEASGYWFHTIEVMRGIIEH